MRCLDDDTVYRLVRGELGDAAMAPVDEHLDSCGDCRALVAIVARGSAPSGGAMALARGAVVGRYVVGDEVGGGAMGVVYAAWDPELDRRVALKVLRDAGEGEARARERVVKEAQAMARLAHPNVVTVHEVGTEDGHVYVAMELVAGRTLRGWAQAPRSWTEVCDVMVQVGRGLAAAHAAGVVHRDVKPENVIVGDDGRARVGDFGLAGNEGIAGTPAYMAPEVLDGVADARSDQLGYCVTFWECLHGERPFVAVPRAGVPIAVERRRVPAWLGAILRRGLSARPDDRFPTMDALLAAIAARRQSRRWLGVVGAAVAASAVTAAVLVSRTPAAATGPSCDVGEDRIATSWNDDARARVRSALGAVRPYGGEVADRVVEQVDRWTAAWAAAADRVCQATEDRPVRDRCLDRRAGELRALVDRLAGADAVVAEHAVDAVGALPAPSECAALTTGDADPLPADPAQRRAIDDVTARLAVVRAALALGDWRDALDRSAEILPIADAGAHHPTMAEAQLVRAEALRAAGRSLDADEAALASLWAAERGHDDAGAAHAWIELTALAGERRDLDLADARARHAAAALDRAGDPAELAAWLESARGLVAYNRGDLDDAETLLSAALAHRRALYGDDHVEVARGLAALGSVARAQGRLDDARVDLEQALAIDRRRLGDRHPAIGRDLHNIAGVLRLAGDLDGALVRYREALAIEIDTLGEAQPQTALTRNSIGLVLLAEHDLDGAERELELALATLTQVNHGDRALALHNLGLVAQTRGDHRAALVRFDEALTVYRGTIGEDAEAPTRLLLDRSVSRRALGQAEQARRDARAARDRAARGTGATSQAVFHDADVIIMRDDPISVPPLTPPLPEKPKRDVGVYGSGQAWP